MIYTVDIRTTNVHFKGVTNNDLRSPLSETSVDMVGLYLLVSTCSTGPSNHPITRFKRISTSKKSCLLCTYWLTALRRSTIASPDLSRYSWITTRSQRVIIYSHKNILLSDQSINQFWAISWLLPVLQRLVAATPPHCSYYFCDV